MCLRARSRWQRHSLRLCLHWTAGRTPTGWWDTKPNLIDTRPLLPRGHPEYVLYGNFAAEDRCCYIVFTGTSIKPNKKMIINVFIPLLLNFFLLLSLKGYRRISYQRLRLLTNTYNVYTLGCSTANRGHFYSTADISINWLLQFWHVWTT